MTIFAELLALYRIGERSFAESELDDDPDHDLSGLSLDGVNLQHSFVAAYFKGASLRNASFFEANVKTCDFEALIFAERTFEARY